MEKNISVIIPMYNSIPYIRKLFDGLNSCQFIEGDEVIIVDNASTDESKSLCEEFAGQNPQLYKVISYNEKADSYAARNYGVSQANGNILAFIDSDCIATPEWLYSVRNKLEKGCVLAGNIILQTESNGVWELFDSMAHLTQCKENAKSNCVATANMSVYKEDFSKVGLFEERFSGGDFEWSKRAAQSGMKIVYLPEAIVYHPSRKTYDEIVTREKRVAYGRGVHHKLMGKSYITLMFAYILRIFKISTQINYSKKMKKRGAGMKDIFFFNTGFFAIRFWYIVYVSRGYRESDPRRYGIK